MTEKVALLVQAFEMAGLGKGRGGFIRMSKNLVLPFNTCRCRARSLWDGGQDLVRVVYANLGTEMD